MKKLNDIELPLVTLKNLTHVGTLFKTDAKKYSLEGAGLSVSLHPDEWRYVGRLSGDTWTFNKNDNLFLNFYALTPEQLELIIAYGVEKGYATYEKRFVYSWYDDEMEQEFSSSFSTLADLLNEHADSENDYDEAFELVATKTFPDFTVNEGDSGILDTLVAAWVNMECPEVDGVWWDDIFAPERYSLPRGVISVQKIEEWVASAAIS